MPNEPEVVKELFHPEGGGTFLVVMTCKAPAVVPPLELVDQDGIRLRVEPKVEVLGNEYPENGLSRTEVVYNLVAKAQIRADGLPEAMILGGDACTRVLILLSLMSNTAHGRPFLKGVLDVTEQRRRRGLMIFGPFVTIHAIRELRAIDVQTAFKAFDKTWRGKDGRHLLESASQYTRGLNEAQNPAEFLSFYLANEKLNPLLKVRGKSRQEREGWKVKDVREVRNTFLHAVTKGSKMKKGDKRVAEHGPRLAARSRNLIGELLGIRLPPGYDIVDKNRPVQPTIVGYIDDPKGAYDRGWTIPSLPSRAVVKGANASGAFRLDLEDLTYDGLLDTRFRIIAKGFETGGRLIQATEPPGSPGA